MLRDARSRGYSPERTLLRWPSVVRGGMKWIFPYQHNADAMFNSSLLYELPVMRVYAEGLLRSIDENSPVRGEAMRLLRLLRRETGPDHQQSDLLGHICLFLEK